MTTQIYWAIKHVIKLFYAYYGTQFPDTFLITFVEPLE